MWFLPSEKYGHIVMVRMVVIFEVHSLLKLAETFQCVVSMVCYLKFILKSGQKNKCLVSGNIKIFS